MKFTKPSGYPRFRICRWGDPTKKSRGRVEFSFLYGIEIKAAKDRPWVHCYKKRKPVLLKTPELASAEIEKLRAKAAE